MKLNELVRERLYEWLKRVYARISVIGLDVLFFIDLCHNRSSQKITPCSGTLYDSLTLSENFEKV